MTLTMLHIENIIERPVKMICYVGYLLVNLLQGVAYDSPSAVPISTSNSCPHEGQETCAMLVPSSLIFL